MSTKSSSTTPVTTIEEAVKAKAEGSKAFQKSWDIGASINAWKKSAPDDEVLQYYTEIYPNDREKAQRMFEEYRERRDRIKTPKPTSVCVVYGLYKEDTLVYIGSTVNPTSRKKDHERDKDFDVFRILYRGSESDMRQLEREIITEEKPVLNIVHNN